MNKTSVSSSNKANLKFFIKIGYKNKYEIKNYKNK